MESGEGTRPVAPESTLEGAISIQSALESGSRPIHEILVRAGRRERDVDRLIRHARAQHITIREVNPAELDALASGRSHGGVIARVGMRRFVALDALIAGVNNPFIAMLDGVEDPFNFGQAIRALYAAGVNGLVLRPRSWENAASVVARASAGTSERMLTAIVETAEAAAEFFRARGFTIAVPDKDRAVSIYDADLSGKLFLLIGGERRGVTRSFADAADIRLKIPYGRQFPMSLGTTSAAAVLAFEVFRQRQGK